MLDVYQCGLVTLFIVIDLMFESRIVRLFGIGFMLVMTGCGPKDKEKSQGSVVAGEGGIIGDETSGLVYRVGESIPYTGKAVWYFREGGVWTKKRKDSMGLSVHREGGHGISERARLSVPETSPRLLEKWTPTLL